jgi:uncharacterized membrane protein YphA (DoxX/SURF4 family)
MNTFTRIFLVLLRLAIGWLFLFEGVEKVHSVNLGPTVSNKPWTSAGYLAQSSGPASSFFHWQAGGDADEKALERFSVAPAVVGEDPAKAPPPRTRASPALKQDWEDYLARFADHYKLSDEQRAAARSKLDEGLDRAVVWLTDNTNKEARERNATFPGAAYTPRETPADRVRAYRDKVAQYRHVQDEALPAFGEDVYKAKLRAVKADAAKMRADLLSDLEAPMKKALEGVLTEDQKKMPALGAAPATPVLAWTDRLVSYGLVAVGAGLLLGLFTRLSCVGGAIFLVMLYLAIPAFPWSPENLRAEGHYLFVNKNLIVALALLALATTRSGMWFGLDGLVQFLNPWRRRAARRAEPTPEPATV